MNRLIEDKVLSEVLRAVSDARPAGEGPHIVDDDELLIRWSVDDLSEEQHAEIVKHLAACSDCRRRLAAMLRAEVLALPERREERAEVVAHPALERASVRTRRRRLAWAVPAAVAAMLLIGIFISQWPGRAANQLTAARQDLAAGRFERALGRLESVVGEEGLDREARTAALALLEESGYKAARAALDANDFQKVLDMEHRVSRHAASSPRLLNLRLQAERGIPAELALAQLASLTDYGYELDGHSLHMGLPVFDQTTERLRKEFAQAVEEHGADVSLRLNYGQFLLSMAQFEQARKQFEAVLALNDRDVLARLGLGLAEFELGNHQKALAEFQAVRAIDPDNLAAQINAAICLQRLKRPDEAQNYWRKALRLSGGRPDLQERIKTRISEK